MSRYNLPAKVEGRCVAVGKDHACGLFIQVFSNKEDREKESEKTGYSVEELEDMDFLLVDRDQTMFSNPPLTADEFLSLIQEYAVNEPETFELADLLIHR